MARCTPAACRLPAADRSSRRPVHIERQEDGPLPLLVVSSASDGPPRLVSRVRSRTRTAPNFAHESEPLPAADSHDWQGELPLPSLPCSPPDAAVFVPWTPCQRGAVGMRDDIGSAASFRYPPPVDVESYASAVDRRVASVRGRRNCPVDVLTPACEIMPAVQTAPGQRRTGPDAGCRVGETARSGGTEVRALAEAEGRQRVEPQGRRPRLAISRTRRGCQQTASAPTLKPHCTRYEVARPFGVRRRLDGGDESGDPEPARRHGDFEKSSGAAENQLQTCPWTLVARRTRSRGGLGRGRGGKAAGRRVRAKSQGNGDFATAPDPHGRGTVRFETVHVDDVPSLSVRGWEGREIWRTLWSVGLDAGGDVPTAIPGRCCPVPVSSVGLDWLAVREDGWRRTGRREEKDGGTSGRRGESKEIGVCG